MEAVKDEHIELKRLRSNLARDCSTVATSVAEFLRLMRAQHHRYVAPKVTFRQLKRSAENHFFTEWDKHPGVLALGHKLITPYIEVIGRRRQAVEKCHHFIKGILMEEGIVTFDEIKLLAKGQIRTPKQVAEAARKVRESRDAKHQAHEAEVYYTGMESSHGLREWSQDRHRYGQDPSELVSEHYLLGSDLVY